MIFGLELLIILFKALVSGFVHFLDFVGLSLEFGNHLIFPLKALDLILLLLHQDAVFLVEEYQLNF